MVTLSVPELGHTRPVCYAYPLLFQAESDASCSRHQLAGVKLLEATRRYLVSLCEYCEVRPARSMRALVRQLLEAGQIDEGIAGWLRDIIDVGQKCQRCEYVRPSLVASGISLLALMLEYSPELELPTRGGAL